MSAPDPAAIMADHHGEPDYGCSGNDYDCPYMWPCPTYRLAEALLAERSKVARVRVVLARADPKTPGVRLFVNWLHAVIADEPEIP